LFAVRVQEPDSFSQGLVGLLEFTHPCLQASQFGFVTRGSGRPRLGQLRSLRWGGCHPTTFSRNQPSVEVTAEHSFAPPRHPATGQTLTDKPRRLLPIGLTVILMNQLNDLP
jgi:hypothetical protein